MKNKILLVIIILGLTGIAILTYKIFLNPTYKTTSASCFIFDKETGTITGYLSVCTANVVIPEEIDDVKVTKIGTQAFMNKELETVIIPNTITEIGIGAFYNNNIKTLKLSKNLQVIKATAFLNNEIEKLTIPTSVTTIGIEAFNNNQVTGASAFIYARDTEGKEDKTMLIGYAGKDKKVSIPDQVENIYLSAFAECQITSVVFSDSVERIDANAFAENSIKELVISKNIIQIGENAFTQNQLESIIVKGKHSLEEFTYLGSNWNNGFEEIIFE